MIWTDYTPEHADKIICDAVDALAMIGDGSWTGTSLAEAWRREGRIGPREEIRDVYQRLNLFRESLQPYESEEPR